MCLLGTLRCWLVLAPTVGREVKQYQRVSPQAIHRLRAKARTTARLKMNTKRRRRKWRGVFECPCNPTNGYAWCQVSGESSTELLLYKLVYGYCFADVVCAPCNGGKCSADSALSFTTLSDPRTGTANENLWVAVNILIIKGSTLTRQ